MNISKCLLIITACMISTACFAVEPDDDLESGICYAKKTDTRVLCEMAHTKKQCDEHPNDCEWEDTSL